MMRAATGEEGEQIRQSSDFNSICKHVSRKVETVEFPLSHDSCRQPQPYVKPEAAITVFELLMMGGVSPETC
jgi:hypothetical protein